MLVSKRLAREAFVRESAPDNRKEAAEGTSTSGGSPLGEDEKKCIPADKPWLNERIFKVGLERCSDDDCPICFEPLPFDGQHYMLRVCCMQRICNGCMMAAYYKGISTCPFCRSETPTSQMDALALLQRRVKANHPMALWRLGTIYLSGDLGLGKNIPRALELLHRAAEVGSRHAHDKLGQVYYNPNYGIKQDIPRALRHWTDAAEQGHPNSRYYLGIHDGNKKRWGRALAHFMIASKMGDKHSLKMIKNMCKQNFCSRMEYAEALRGFQLADDEMHNKQREDGQAFAKVFLSGLLPRY
mmetsp:Transcript_4717/g.10566  ORF Transcript_4717/g.10566 Transcript_4717/m.10566 type:complete len:299 (+) Transcript_4717:321-1217(+)